MFLAALETRLPTWRMVRAKNPFCIRILSGSWKAWAPKIPTIAGRLPALNCQWRHRCSFQFDHNCSGLAFDQLLPMGAVSRIEIGVAERNRAGGHLTVGRGGHQFALLHVNDHDVFVMEMQDRRLTWRPGVIPNDDAVVLKKLFAAFSRESQRQTGLVFTWWDLRILQFDEDGVTRVIADA